MRPPASTFSLLENIAGRRVFGRQVDHPIDVLGKDRTGYQDQSAHALGYAIIANMGDQMSDLDGGFAERTFKLPNPFYYIP